MSRGHRVVEERDAGNGGEVIFDCVVIGAGLTGLSAAFALQNTLNLLDGQHAVSERSVLVVDSGDRVGGLVGTKLLKADGSEIVPAKDELYPSTPHDYLVELGPNSFQPTPRLLGLLRAIGIEDRIITSDPSAPRFLLHEDKLVTLPMSLTSFFCNFPAVDLKSKMKVILGLFGWRPSPPSGTEESIGAFIDRLAGGSRFRECLLQPFMSGVYTGDAMRLSGDVVLGGLAAEDREEGGVFISLMKGRKAKSGPLSVSYSADAGVGADSRPAVATRTPLEGKEIADIIHTFCPALPQGELGIRRGSLCSFKKGMITLPLALEQWLKTNSVASTKIVEPPNKCAAPPLPEGEQEADGAVRNETSPFYGRKPMVRTEVRLRTRVTSVSWSPTENLWNIVVETNSPTTRVTPPCTGDTNVQQKQEPSIVSTQKKIKARTLLSTLPAYAASKLFGPLSSSLGDQLDSIEYPSIAAVAVAVKASALNRSSPPCQAAAAAAHELAIDESIRKVIATFEDDDGALEEKKLLDVLSARAEHGHHQQIGRLLSCASDIRGFGQLLTDFNSSTTIKMPDGGGDSECASRTNKVIGAIYASSLFPLNRTPAWSEAEVLKKLNAEREERIFTGPPVGGEDRNDRFTSPRSSSPSVSLPPLLPEVFVGEARDGTDSGREEILLCFVGGARHASVARMTESELFDEVCQFFRHKDSVVQDVKGIRLLASKVLEKSIPQPLIGHQARVRSILDAVRNIPTITTTSAAIGNVSDRDDVSTLSGGGGGSDHCFCPLVLCGTWRDGVSVGDCVHAGIRRGVELARELLNK